MKTWIGAGLLAATLMVTGCAGNGYYYGRNNYRYDRDYRYRNYRDQNNRHRDGDRDGRDDRDNWRYR